MKKEIIPVYDICTIDDKLGSKDLLIENFADYLSKHYQHLHRPHKHSFYHLVLFTKGKGTHTIDFEKFSVKPFQIYFMIPGQVHSWHFDGDVDGYIIHFNETLFRSFLQNEKYIGSFSFFNGNSKDGVRQLPARIQSQAARLFDVMLEEMNVRTSQYLDVLRLKLLELFILVERNSNVAKTKAAPQQKLLLLRNFEQLINEHYRDIKLPKEYAALLYITPNHLNALCQDMLGKKAGELIRERVLLEAKRMLTNADMSISEIAYDLNFQDNSYFNRMFKKEGGVTPDEFRKKFIVH
jgi:AraC-like DNA-binding protein